MEIKVIDFIAVKINPLMAAEPFKSSIDFAFIGETAFYIAFRRSIVEAGRPFWAMNYAGSVLSEKFSGDFLKEALLAVPYEHPFRGSLQISFRPSKNQYI